MFRPALIISTSLALFACAAGEDKRPIPPLPGPLQAAAVAVDLTPLVEPFEDLDGNGYRDGKEPFEDLNGDGVYNPVWIAGFSMNRPAMGVHDPIEARILLLDKDGLRIAFVSVDWVGLLYDDVLWLRSLADEAGLGLDALIFTSTHNHEGPDTMGIWGPGVFASGRDPDYLADSFAAIVDSLLQAEAKLAPARILAGLGQTEGLIHDSRLPEVFDETVLALRIERTEDDSAMALVVHWGNHPECLGGDNQLITSDFPGALRRRLEEAAPGALGIYWQGMVGGLMNPLHVDVTDEAGQVLPKNSFEKSDRMGLLVAEEALAALEQAEDITAGGRLAFARREILIQADNPELVLAMQIGLVNRSTFDAEGVEHPTHELDPAYFRTEVWAFDIGLLQLVTAPGEIYPESVLLGPEGETLYQTPQDPGADFFGTECEAPIYSHMRTTPYRAILGLANDELGYLVPTCQYDDVAPFAYGRDKAQYGEVFCPNPELSQEVLRSAADALGELNDR